MKIIFTYIRLGRNSRYLAWRSTITADPRMFEVFDETDVRRPSKTIDSQGRDIGSTMLTSLDDRKRYGRCGRWASTLLPRRTMRELASKDENVKVPLGKHPGLQPVVENNALYRVLCVCVCSIAFSRWQEIRFQGKNSWCCFQFRSMYTRIYKLS